MQPAASPFNFQGSILDQSPAPPASATTMPVTQRPGGSSTGVGQQRPRQVNSPTNNQGLGAQGMVGGHGHGPQMHAQNQAQYNQYQVQYNQYLNNLNRSVQQQQQQQQLQQQHTIEDLNNSLRSLKNEKDHIIARGNPDRMDDFLRG